MGRTRRQEQVAVTAEIVNLVTGRRLRRILIVLQCIAPFTFRGQLGIEIGDDLHRIFSPAPDIVFVERGETVANQVTSRVLFAVDTQHGTTGRAHEVGGVELLVG